MRYITLIVAGLIGAATLACEESSAPTLASIGGGNGTDTGGGTTTGTGTTGSTGGTTSGTTTVTIGPSATSVVVGGSTQFITNQFNDQVQWRSLNPEIAGISPTGLAVGFAPGSAIISVRLLADTTKEARATLTVVSATP